MFLGMYMVIVSPGLVHEKAHRALTVETVFVDLQAAQSKNKLPKIK